MKIILFGGTGFIGNALLQSATMRKHEVFVVTRHPEKREMPPHENVHFVKADDRLETNLAALFTNQYAVVNLAGESLGNWPWSKIQKQRILVSRVRITSMISKLVSKASEAPEFIIQSSAVGYYGFKHPGPVNETTAPGENFLAKVCRSWEDALQVNKEKTRVVIIRTGLVLGHDGGLLEMLKLPFYLFAGGPLGNGKQMMSWIHLNDEISAIAFLMDSPQARGAYNLVAPHPVTMKQLMKTIGKKMHRPSWIPVPAFILRFVLGKSFANELILGGLAAIPEKLLNEGFEFKFTHIDDALSDLI